MDYALLWLGSLAATLFFMTAGLGAAASLPARRKRLLAAGGVFLLLLSPGLFALLLSAAARFSYGYPGSWFGYILSWNLHLWAGTTLAAWGAFRAREGAPAGKSWAFRGLLLGGGVFAALTVMTFWAIDDGIRGRIQTLRAEAGAMALAAAAPRVPDSENAAPLYQEAFESLKALRDRPPVPEERLEKWLDEGPAEADLKGADLEVLLAASAGDLALLRRAASMPGCHFVRNTENLYALFESELNHYRKAMQEYVNWLSLPYPEARPQVEAARGKIEAKRTLAGRFLLPALSRLFESVPRADAYRRLARAAAAAAAFRDGEGRYPERLEELRPKYAERIPQDPFDGRPLRLARKGTGVVVYSVGLNGKDEGGDLSNDPSTGTPLDLGIRVGPAK